MGKKEREKVKKLKSKQAEKAAKKEKIAEKAAKKAKKDFVVPEVLRAESLATVVSHNIAADEEASDKVKSLPKKDLRYIIDVINATELGHLENGGKVQFMPYFTLEPKARLPRNGRNPQNGETIKIKGSRYVSFRSGKGLKDLMNRDEKKVAKAIKEHQAAKDAREAKKAEKASAKKEKSSKKDKKNKKVA